MTINEPTIETEVRNPMDTLQDRYEWLIKWKDTDLDLQKIMYL